MTRSTDTVRKPIASTQIPEYFNQQKILTEMLPGILFIWMMPPQFTSNINVQCEFKKRCHFNFKVNIYCHSTNTVQ